MPRSCCCRIATARQIAFRIKVPLVSSALILILIFSLIGTLQFFTEPQALRLVSNGTITPAMHDAGAVFRAQFRAAALDTLRATPLVRVPGGAGDTPTERQAAARQK